MEYFRKTISIFFEYDTPKIVHIKSKRIGITNRLLQIIIVSYIVGFAIVWQKGYQLACPVSSAVTTKVKGVTFTNVTKQMLDVPGAYSSLYKRVWDPTDYVIPTSGGEYGGFFITTNVVITPNQTRGTCAEVRHSRTLLQLRHALHYSIIVDINKTSNLSCRVLSLRTPTAKVIATVQLVNL